MTDISILKDDICNILQDNGAKIERVKSEIADLSTSADSIVKELEVMKSKGINLSLLQCCEFCSSTPLFNKPFYLFPCGHGYHIDCMVHLYIGEKQKNSKMVSSAQESMSDAIRNRVLRPAQLATITNLSEQIASLSSRINRDSAVQQEKRVAQQVDMLQAELDAIIASDCPLCGDLMIKLIGVSLTTVNTPRDLVDSKSWQL